MSFGTWIAKLAGHKRDAALVLHDPHSIAAYVLVFGLVFLILVLWVAIIIVTAVRIYKIYFRRSENGDRDIKTALDLQMGKKILKNLRRRVSTGDLHSGEFEMVELLTTPGPVARLKSTKLGIKLMGGVGTNYIPGDTGIFVANVRPGTTADGKLYIGDRIVALNNFRLTQVTLKYAKEVMQALSQAEGHLRFCVKRAPIREQRVNRAFSLYCDDVDTGKKEVVFSKEHMEVFEEAFSIFDVRGSGKIPMKHFFQLVRTLGYNIHKSEAFEYMNELELADKQKITFNELIKFLEHIVAEQTTKYEVRCVYNVFDQDQIGHVPVDELHEALERLYGQKLTEDEIVGILSVADIDKDGFVGEEDFERLLLPSLVLY